MVNNKINKMFKKIIIFSMVSILLYPALSYLFWLLIAPGSGSYINKIEDAYKELASEQLIDKIQGYGNVYSISYFSPYPHAAFEVLIERKEKKAVPTILKLLNCWDVNRRRYAIWGLGVIDDKRAVEPLMEIVKKGESYPNYKDALMALSRMKVEEAFPYVEKLAKQDDAKANGSIAMLREFGKPEGIELLQNIRSKIKDTDNLAKFDRSQIDKAIEEIKASQKK